MDKITIQNLKCLKHQKKDLQFIQVNDVLNQQQINKPLFYCSSCFNHDLQFKSINYLMIDQIFQEADNSIIPKWPPVNDYQIISDLIEITQNQSELDYAKQITNFFNDLKDELLAKIDSVQKKMINEALKYPVDSQKIIKRYQEISKIQQFKQLLSNQQANSIKDHTNFCREFISKIESQKDKNTELLQELLTQANEFQTNFNLEYPHCIKKHLFTFIDQISFFKQDLNQNILNIQQENSNNENNSIKLSANLIMKLVSNKSNFCTDEFLNDLNQNLQRLNPLFENSTFKKIFQENKAPLDFSKISSEKLNQIEDYVNHQILLVSNLEYQEQIKNSQEIKQFKQILNSKFSFLNRQFTEQFEKCLTDIIPYLKQLNFSNIITDQKKFEFFINLQNEKFNNLLYHYPMINQISVDNLLYGAKFNGGQTDCQVKKNKNREIIIQKLNKQSSVNIILDLCLQKDLKYIFKFQVESINEGDCFLIGIMSKSKADSIGGFDENLSCKFVSQEQYIYTSAMNFGISKKIKGADFRINKDKIIELRVCLIEQILEVADYPNYQYIQGLEDEHKTKLTQYDDLIFYLNLFQPGIKIILKDIQIVNEFTN
ncbi:hypothetical protein ABPG72_021932 [Tetrahymena utriculariae]